jgi:adhesin/invasin
MPIDRRLISLSLILTGWLAAENPTGPTETRHVKPPQLAVQHSVQGLGSVPLVFEPNLGQTDPQVRFLARAAGMTSFLTDRANVMVLSRRKNKPAMRAMREPRETPDIEQAVVRMKIEGARVPLSFEGLEKAESISNYFIGNDPSKWRANVPNYRKVRATGIYPGVDVVYYGDGRKLEYDFIVGPGADPSRIHLAYEGADHLNTDQEGNLLIATRLGTLMQRKPIVYQEINGERREVRASYSIRKGKVEFAVANWDRRRELVIDPTLAYSTYLGGNADDRGFGIALDDTGAAYVTGYTTSTNFPTQLPLQQTNHGNNDAFVTKLNATGNALVYSTYLGGTESDQGNAIAVDSTGQAYVTGSTQSNDFPVTSGAYSTSSGGTQDIFVTKLTVGGTLLYSTYVGKSGQQEGNGIALDATGAAYITGDANSSAFPTTAGAFQTNKNGAAASAIVIKLNSSGSDLMYSTYLGGGSTDIGQDIAVDSAGLAYVTGYTASTDFPTTSGAYQTTLSAGGSLDIFVTKLNATGTALIYSTYVGSPGTNRGYGIAIDTSGEAYITGSTSGSNFPTTTGAAQTMYGGGASDAFVTKLNAAGSALVYSTYIGGLGNDAGYGITVDASGAAMITGFTQASNFPVTAACAIQPTIASAQDAFVTKLNAAGSALAYSSYLGGSLEDTGRGIATTANGVPYITGYTAGNFPTTTGAFQTTFGGGAYDAFVTKLTTLSSGSATAISVAGGSPQTTVVHTAFGTPLTAKVTDSAGNPVFGVTVTFTAPGSGASATFSSTTATTDCAGLASVTATANTVAGTYSVTASTPGGTSASFNLTNTAGAATHIDFVQQPTSTVAGQTINAPGGVTVRLTDADGNPINNSLITMSIFGGSAALYGTPSQTTGADGIATFGDLSIHSAGSYQLQATYNGLSALSNPFPIAAGSAKTIAALNSGQSAVEGEVFPSPLRALVTDPFGNPVSGATVTFTVVPGPATVTFSGGTSTVTATTDSDGRAISPLVTAGSVTGPVTVMASTSGATTPANFSLTILAGTADRLAFTQEPPLTTPAGALFTVTVQVKDSGGNLAPGIPVTLRLISGTLVGNPASVTTGPDGLATFSGLSVQKSGQYYLRADASGTASAISITFIVTAGSAAHIQPTGGTPQSTTILTQFAVALQATVTDTFDNPVSGVTVNFAAPASGASATLVPLSMTTDANGHASTTATANSTAGGSYNVTATVPSMPGSAAFALTNVTGAVGHITFVAPQPSNTEAGAIINQSTGGVVVLLTDAGGNPVPGASVTLGLQPSTATLNGNPSSPIITNAMGEVTFANLSITTAGTFHLVATSGMILGQSNDFTITPVTGSSNVRIFVFDGSGQSASVNTAFSGPLKARVQDLYGNPLVGQSVTFAPPNSGASVIFSGDATVTTGSDGIATSPTMTANSQVGVLIVSASTPNAAGSALFNLANLAGPASRLTFVQQPTDTTAGAPITPSVTVQLQDSSGNSVHTAGVPITIQSNAVVRRLQLLSGTLTENTDVNGLATFADMSISQVGAYTLTATGSDVASATSNSFNITAGVPTSILATGGTPQDAIIQTVYIVPLQATITDTNSNPVSGVPVTFTAPTSGPSGTFGGQPTFTINTDTQGHASAVITANSIAGTFGVVAASAALTGSPSAVFSLTNLPVGAGSLVFVQQPSNAAAGQAIAPPVTVQVRDGSGKPVNVAGVPIVLSLSAGTGTLLGTLVQLTDSTGTATFNDLNIAATGAKRLRATSSQQAPVDSIPFQITAGAAASITVFSGAPQATPVSQPFNSLLQAQVKDIAGNPVGGASVGFLAPTSGPSGTFAGLATVTTNANGIATAPVLTANNQVGSFVVTATAAGVSGSAAFALTNLPQQTSQTVLNPGQLSFANESGQPAPPGQTVQITSATGGVVTWTATSSAPWLVVTPTSGITPAQITVSVNPTGLAPGTYTGSIFITDSAGGVSVLFVTYTLSGKPALVITPPTLAFTTTSNTVTPAAQMLQATSTSRTIQYSVTAQVSTPAGGNWLQISTTQGQTAGTVVVTANPAGLSTGVYAGSVRFTPSDATVNSVAVPVILIVGCGQGGCTIQPNILAVVNAASFHPTGAPAAIMTIFGTMLSDAIYQSSAFPLPTTLGPTSVTVNGVAAPLFYVSPTQINFQMLSGVPAAGVTVSVNNATAMGTFARAASPSHPSSLTTVDPGLFVTPNRRAAALNVDLSPHTASTPIPAGGYVILFLTGQGPVTPSVADGTPAPASPLSIINAPVQVTVGGQNAQVTYQGLAPGFAGLAQLNVIVPSGLTPGDQSVFITINGVPSNAGVIAVK